MRNRLSKVACLAALLVGCAGTPGREPTDPTEAPGSPVHRTAEAWTFPESPSVAGQGECAGVTLASVLEAIRRDFADVADIGTFRAWGPRGVVMNPGLPVAEGSPVMAGTETSSFVVGLMDARSFGAVFFRGARCRGDLCEDRAYWYFETAAGCRPALVGQHRVVQKAGGRFGTCLDVTGAPLWSFPGEPVARQRSDADWSAQDISKTWPAYSLRGPDGTCSTHEAIVPVDVTITQERDLARARVVVRGTGLAFLDGRDLGGTVERQSLEGMVEETTAEPCAVHRTIRVRLDFEENNNGLPGGFGLIDIDEQRTGTCPAAEGACWTSLHLMHRD
jgi:hypothetical protein